MNEHLFVSLDELEKGNHTKRVAVRNFPEWDVSAKLRNDISSPDRYEKFPESFCSHL